MLMILACDHQSKLNNHCIAMTKNQMQYMQSTKQENANNQPKMGINNGIYVKQKYLRHVEIIPGYNA
jgi:uncharacterized protein (DUF342 family)